MMENQENRMEAFERQDQLPDAHPDDGIIVRINQELEMDRSSEINEPQLLDQQEEVKKSSPVDGILRLGQKMGNDNNFGLNESMEQLIPNENFVHGDGIIERIKPEVDIDNQNEPIAMESDSHKISSPPDGMILKIEEEPKDDYPSSFEMQPPQSVRIKQEDEQSQPPSINIKQATEDGCVNKRLQLPSLENVSQSVLDSSLKVTMKEELQEDGGLGQDSEDSEEDSSSSSSGSEDSSSSDSSSEDSSSSEDERRRRRPIASDSDDDFRGSALTTNREPLIQDLPEVMPVDIILDPTEVVKQLGEVSSVIGQLVVVQSDHGMEALDTDTVLFKDDKHAFGKVFEVFGPVTCPLYTVRFNSVSDVTNLNIELRMKVYFAPNIKDITQYVFTQKLRQIKGTDASWEHDEEPPSECIEYSDDDQERAAKGKKKQDKRKRKTPQQRIEDSHGVSTTTSVNLPQMRHQFQSESTNHRGPRGNWRPHPPFQPQRGRGLQRPPFRPHFRGPSPDQYRPQWHPQGFNHQNPGLSGNPQQNPYPSMDYPGGHWQHNPYPQVQYNPGIQWSGQRQYDGAPMMRPSHPPIRPPHPIIHNPPPPSHVHPSFPPTFGVCANQRNNYQF